MRNQDRPESGRGGRREFLRRGAAALASIAGLGAFGPLIAVPAEQAGTVLVFGDSLSAGYGMSRDEAWPTLLGLALQQRKEGRSWQLVNASISGETTHGGLARLPATLERTHPDVVILELGGNDALRGMPIEETRRNLEAMAAMVVAHHARLLVVGIALPPNYGDDYTSAFAEVFRATAAHHHAALVPNLVASLGTSRQDFQADGIHPQGRAQPRLLETVMAQLAPLLRGRS